MPSLFSFSFSRLSQPLESTSAKKGFHLADGNTVQLPQPLGLLASLVDQDGVDVVLVDLDEHIEREPGYLDNLLDHLREQCRLPVLFNDSSAAAPNVTIGDLGKKLTIKLTSMMSRG